MNPTAHGQPFTRTGLSARLPFVAPHDGAAARPAGPAPTHPGNNAPGRLVHLVGRLTEPAFEFLRPASEALAQSGVEQCVVLLDDARSRSLLPQFDARVQVATVADTRGLLRRWAATQGVLRQVLDERPVAAVHLHGMAAWLLGERIARRASPAARLFYSLHGSTLLSGSRVSNAMLLWAAQGQPATGHDRHGGAAGAVFGRNDVAIIENPLGKVFFDTPLSPARRPLIVTSSLVDRPRSALTFAQCAVLLGDESLGLSFNWVGTAAAESRAALKAANVAVFDAPAPADRASRLCSGWVYLAVGDAPGFPLCLVEAMALGLPCIAVDTPHTRAVIRHCETGFLCRNGGEIRQAIADLIDAPELRERLGSAARLDTLARFGEGRFRSSVLSAYALTAA